VLCSLSSVLAVVVVDSIRDFEYRSEPATTTSLLAIIKILQALLRNIQTISDYQVFYVTIIIIIIIIVVVVVVVVIIIVILIIINDTVFHFTFYFIFLFYFIHAFCKQIIINTF
jgi:hypothetical protein